jgi:hypothetical protein
MLVAWDAPSVDWSASRLCVIRATWEYHLRLPEVLTWAERVAAQTALWNPPDLVRSNMRKRYCVTWSVEASRLFPPSERRAEQALVWRRCRGSMAGRGPSSSPPSPPAPTPAPTPRI